MGYFTGFCKKNMATKMLFEIPVLYLISVLLESRGRWGATSEAFIFSLNNKEGMAPFLRKVTPGRVGSAIDRHSYYGPKFGQYIVIHVEESRKHSSRARLGDYYPFPAAVHNWLTVLAGTEYFSPDEVEVFYLDPSPLVQDNTN